MGILIEAVGTVVVTIVLVVGAMRCARGFINLLKRANRN